jgi:thiamine transporter
MKQKTKIITMAEIAVFASIGFILDLLAGLYSGFFVNGGSISFAMVAVIILSYRRGCVAGVCCGLIMGLLDLTDGFYTFADTWYNSIIQIGMDYIFTYMLVDIVALAKPLIKKFNYTIVLTVSTVLAGTLKFISHFLSGILFWPEFPNQPFLERCGYSLVYNGGYMLPSIILSAVIVCLMSIKFKQLFLLED